MSGAAGRGCGRGRSPSSLPALPSISWTIANHWGIFSAFKTHIHEWVLDHGSVLKIPGGVIHNFWHQRMIQNSQYLTWNGNAQMFYSEDGRKSPLSFLLFLGRCRSVMMAARLFKAARSSAPLGKTWNKEARSEKLGKEGGRMGELMLLLLLLQGLHPIDGGFLRKLRKLGAGLRFFVVTIFGMQSTFRPFDMPLRKEVTQN